MDAQIAVGATGDFEVSSDSGPVFSKRATGRFPNPGEVEELVKQLLG